MRFFKRHFLLIGIIFLYGLLSAVLLNRALLTGYTLLPLDLIQTIAPWDGMDLGPLANSLISDPFYSFYPRRFFLTESIRAGQLPLWNPFIMSGTPTLANPNFQLFYPPNLVGALLLSAKDALPWLAWFHLTVTGILMFLFLRRHRLHWLATIFGGGLWLLSGYNLVWLENPHRLSTAAWIPGIFWAYEAATQDKKAGWAALGGIFLGLSILGGQAQYVFGIALMLGLYGLVKFTLDLRETRRWQVQSFGYLALLGVIGLGVGALMLIPASEFVAISQRGRFDPATIANTRWPISQLITLVAPNYYGNPAGEVAYWGAGNYAEATAYFGVVALLLALSAPIVGRRGRFLIYALTLAIATLLITLGSPLARLVALLPGGEFVSLSRMIFLIPFAGVLLAAAGLDGWLTLATQHQSTNGTSLLPRMALALGSAILVILIISLWTTSTLGVKFSDYRGSLLRELGRSAVFIGLAVVFLFLLLKWPLAAGILLVVVALADLLIWGLGFNPITSVENLYPENEVVEWLRRDEELYRVLPLQSGKVLFGPNVLSLFGFQELGGYTPLIQDSYYELYKSIDDQVDIKWMRSNTNMLVMSNYDPIVGLFNVKYVLSNEPLAFDIMRQASQEECDSLVSLAETPLSQTFVASDPGLNRVDLTFGESKETNQEAGDVQFRLWREMDERELVADITLLVGEVTIDQPIPFYFAPVPDSAGDSFMMEISGPATLSVCVSENDLQFAAYATWLQQKDHKQGVWIYENPNVLPRAYMVHHTVQSSPDSALDAIHDTNFNWHRSAVLETTLPEQLQRQLSSEPIRSNSQVTTTGYQNHEVDLMVQSDQAGVVVLTDAYYPGWQVKIDGQPAEIYRTNSAMRGVFVPAGNHQVQFQFRPTSLRLASIIASICLLVALILIGATLLNKYEIKNSTNMR